MNGISMAKREIYEMSEAKQSKEIVILKIRDEWRKWQKIREKDDALHRSIKVANFN